jgi:hypothetical protein
MSDIGDLFNDVKKISQDKREKNRETSANILQKKEINFIVKNYGTHLIVEGKNGLIDFWPGTGKFIARNGGKGRGVFNLIKLCR